MLIGYDTYLEDPLSSIHLQQCVQCVWIQMKRSALLTT